jgi:hydrogenase maturation protease HycI
MDLQEQLATRIHGSVVIMGIGNPGRGDDGVGSLVARRISNVPGARVIDAQDVPEDYLGLIVRQKPDTVVLIDSVDLDSAPGSIALLDKDQMAGYWPSTHRAPVSLLMDYLQRETQALIFLIGIQPRQTDFLEPMSEEVFSSAAHIAGLLSGVLEMPKTPAHAALSAPLRKEVPV